MQITCACCSCTLESSSAKRTRVIQTRAQVRGVQSSVVAVAATANKRTNELRQRDNNNKTLRPPRRPPAAAAARIKLINDAKASLGEPTEPALAARWPVQAKARLQNQLDSH